MTNEPTVNHPNGWYTCQLMPILMNIEQYVKVREKFKILTKYYMVGWSIMVGRFSYANCLNNYLINVLGSQNLYKNLEQE